MQIANLAKKLEAVGLTEKQAKVYVAALFLGPAPVQRIAEQAEVNRATTYVILDELAAMGLVSTSVEGKKTVFVAESPEAIERYLNSIEKDINERKDSLKHAMSDLKDISRIEADDAPVVRFFKGPEAAQAVSSYLKRKAKKNTVVYAMTDIDEVMRVFPDIMKQNPIQRKKKNIGSRLFYSGSIDVLTDNSLNRKSRRLPSRALGDVNIYDDRMTILIYRGGDSVGVIIESKEIVAVMRQLFELAWSKQSKKK